FSLLCPPLHCPSHSFPTRRSSDLRSFSQPHAAAGSPSAPRPCGMKPTVAVALTGASGMPYGLRLVETLIRAEARVYLLYSQAAHVVATQEVEIALAPRASDTERMCGE